MRQIVFEPGLVYDDKITCFYLSPANTIGAATILSIVIDSMKNLFI